MFTSPDMFSKAATLHHLSSEIAYTHVSPPRHPDENGTTYPPIMFLHGSESCRLEFSRVIPFLRDDYELYLVDLPGHSRSRAIPFSFNNAINAISHLIRNKVTGGKAHIVGLSLGGFIGMELARRHPELLLSLWATGCAPLSGPGLWLRKQSRLLSGLVSIAGCLATESLFWASLGVDPIPGFREEVQSNQNMATLKPVFDEITSVTLDDYSEIKGIKIALIAGGKGDNVEDTTQAGKLLREGNPECNAFVVKEAIHWWSLQLPEVFAGGVRAWIEGTEMPKEYAPLL